MARTRRGIKNRIIASQSLDLSVTQKTGAIARAKEVWALAQDARELAEYRQAWLDLDLQRLHAELPFMPDDSTDELKRLRTNSSTPWGRAIINELSQGLAVDDFRLAGDDASAPAFSIWQQNGLDARQVPLHRGAMTHGQAYNLVLPATGRLDGAPTALIRGKSMLRMTAFYRDEFDEYPEFALEVVPQPNSDGTTSLLVTLYDDAYVYRMSCEKGDGSDLTYIDNYRHGMGVCPVVRFAMIDLEGESLGEITPLIPLFRRLDQGTCDRLIVQRFGAFVVRTISGMAKPKTEEDRKKARVALGSGDFMVSPDADTKFGHIPGTPIDGYLRATSDDVKSMASIAQIPSYRFLGLGDNIGADAIRAATESQERKTDEYRRVYGEAHEASMRLAGHAVGDTTIAQDFTSRVHWVPRSSESLQTLTQGLATMTRDLEIDPSLVWDYLPDWSRDKTDKAQELREEARDREMLAAALGAAGGEADAGQPDSAPVQGA
jgi:hypothetical protein